jgi:hypothetical protein
MNDHLGVGGSGEDRTALFQLVAHFLGVDQVAVMGDGDAAPGIVDGDRLAVLDIVAAGRGVAHVPDGAPARKTLEGILVLEHIGDEAESDMGPKPGAVGSGDAAPFLAAMLQCVKTEIGHIGRFGVAIDSENTAFFVEFIEHKTLFPA